MLRGAGCLGPSFLQLPSGFSAYHLEDLRQYLGRLPAEYPYAVEVRNADFFAGGQAEQSLNQLLAELGIDRVILDSRPLFSAPPETEYETASQGRKPRVAVHTKITGTRPIIRLIGRDDVRRVKPWIVEWSRIIAKWLHSGLQPFVFTHTPDERYAPHLARDFHSELLRHTELIGEMPAWPGEVESHSAQQLRLF